MSSIPLNLDLLFFSKNTIFIIVAFFGYFLSLVWSGVPKNNLEDPGRPLLLIVVKGRGLI